MKLAVLKDSQDKKNVTISCVPYSVGRSRNADFVIAHVNVSRNHCNFVKENKSWKVTDFSSSGTYVNDALVGRGESVMLKDGDSVRFGPVENNLCWTFYSLDSTCENTKPKEQVFLNFYNEKCCLKEKKASGGVVIPKSAFEEPNLTTDSSIVKKISGVGRTHEVEQEEQEKEFETIKFDNTEDLQNGKVSSAKQENINGKSESEKVQELTKELQEVQNALNDLEEKNSALQMELAAGTSGKTETSVSTTLLENLTDLVEVEFQCTICSELFVTAVTLSCTHTFCKFCISQWKKKQKTCPICRKKITNETRSLVVDNYIDKVVGNLSLELKERREAIIKERNETEPPKKRSKLQNKKLTK